MNKESLFQILAYEDNDDGILEEGEYWRPFFMHDADHSTYTYSDLSNEYEAHGSVVYRDPEGRFEFGLTAVYVPYLEPDEVEEWTTNSLNFHLSVHKDFLPELDSGPIPAAIMSAAECVSVEWKFDSEDPAREALLERLGFLLNKDYEFNPLDE